jgi:hypothetical protein
MFIDYDKFFNIGYYITFIISVVNIIIVLALILHAHETPVSGTQELGPFTWSGEGGVPIFPQITAIFSLKTVHRCTQMFSEYS